jgi:hypothetical protein
MKRSSTKTGPVPDHQKRLKYNSLLGNAVWNYAYDELPNDILANIWACVVNKPGFGRAHRSIKKFARVASTELDKWLKQKEKIPTDVARRLLFKFDDIDLRRLQLTEPVHLSLTSNDSEGAERDIDPTSSNPLAATDPVGNAAADNLFNTDEYSSNNVESSDSDNFVALDTAKFDLDNLPNKTTFFDEETRLEVDPRTGFFKERPSFRKVIRKWARSEFGVKKASVTRFLHMMHRYKPLINDTDYDKANKNGIPRTADTLVRIPPNEHKFVIRDLQLYDLVKDEFPADETVVGLNVPDTDVEGDDSSSSDEEEETEIIVDEATVVDCSAPPVCDDSDGADDEFEEETDEEVIIDPSMPEWKLLRDDITKTMKSDETKMSNKPNQKMVYFGLENILTCSNSAGNIHKGSYFNFLRAIALLDPTALTDEVVDRVFPKNSKVHDTH